ncbi:MAG: RRXRR domain-containing protein [Mastigocoleus sp. MO_167.B18]|nr:RRXRR domain-containing protein [Mastigocoleus sp. MO_167.B18]
MSKILKAEGGLAGLAGKRIYCHKYMHNEKNKIYRRYRLCCKEKTKPSRARRWLKQGKAKLYKNDLQVFAIQINFDPSGRKEQKVVAGIDPGKLFTGIAVQSAKFTLWLGHLYLPFQKVKDRMETRAMMRRNRRSRRINRKQSYNQRAHRQARFDNRRQNKIGSFNQS